LELKLGDKLSMGEWGDMVGRWGIVGVGGVLDVGVMVR